MIQPDKKHPEWLLSNPEPLPVSKKFNSKEYPGWEGVAQLDKLIGWADNPRIDIPVQLFKEEHLGRAPNKDELLEIMLDVSVEGRNNDDEENEDEVDNRRSRKNKLLELAESIRLNGVRVPLVVTHDKRILDGNRRFFAALYLHQITENKDEQAEYSKLPVWVLPKGIGEDDEDRILTELNSINDCYVRWPYSVVARRVYKDFVEGAKIEDLGKKYHDWTESRLRTVIEASKVAAEFIEHHGDSAEAQDIAYRKLIWFDELRRSNSKAMGKEAFRSTIYDLILKENSPFTSHKDFKRLGEIYENPEAWEILTTRRGKEALQQALFVVDRERYEGKSDAESRMKRVNSLLQSVIVSQGFNLVTTDTLRTFHELSTKVPSSSLDSSARVERLLELLNGLVSEEIARLPKPLLRKMGTVLERVKTQAESFKESK